MNQWLSTLDRWLVNRGEAIYLRRTTGTVNQSYVQCELLAIVRPLTAEQLLGNITTQNFLLIVSPSDIIRQQWPGGKPPPPTGDIISPVDPRIPVTTDEVYLRGAKRVIKRVAPIFECHTCIRIEILVLG